VHTPIASTLLLTGGRLFAGCWQHRVLVRSVVVAAESVQEVEVRCVEQGRWAGPTRLRLHAGARRWPCAAPCAVSFTSPGHPATFGPRADQAGVWQLVHLSALNGRHELVDAA
jgi:hypothetical protein